MDNLQTPPNDTPQANIPPQAPATGAIPPQASPKPVPPPPTGYIYPAPIKQRRVGTFTLGLTLILIGVMVPLCMIFHDQAIRWFQFAPVVLVFLGIEVLYYAIRYKEGKLRYDGVSIFLVLMLTVISVITASISPFVSRSTAYYSDLETRRMAFEDTVEDIMGENGYTSESVGYYYSSSSNNFFRIMNYDNDSDFFTNASVGIAGSTVGDEENPTADEIVDAFYRVASALWARDEFKFRSLDMWMSVPSGYTPSIHLNKSQLENLSREDVRQLALDLPEIAVPDDVPTDDTASDSAAE